MALVFAACASEKGDPGGPGCGNGEVEAGEICDDGNTSSGDGCSAICLAEPARCGDSRVDPSEVCDDGNDVSGDGCSASCLREGSGLCGNGVRENLEACDDGNTSNSDDCLNTCIAARCGDGNTRTGMEECDSGAANSDSSPNACRLDCTRPFCGDGVKDTGMPNSETCDDSNTMSGDGCSNVCVKEPRCGDGERTTNEGCDDGNTMNGDGCTSLCALEPGHVFELEPNDTYLTATTIDRGQTLHGAFPTTSDIDWYKVVVTVAVDLKIETFEGATTTCTNMDTRIELHRANTAGTGTTLIVSDDDDGAGYCSLIDPDAGATYPDVLARRLPAGTYWIKVTSYDPAIDYRVVVSQVATCGNGMMEGSESCDDSNVTPGDNCSVLCVIEPVCGNRLTEEPEQCDDGNSTTGDGCNRCVLEEKLELEPNDAIGQRTHVGTLNSGLLIRGAITPVNELDFYSFDVSVTSDLRIETLQALSPLSCDTADTKLELRGTDGAMILASDDNDGVGNCSLIQPTTDVKARRLAPGRYTLVVSAAVNASIASYLVKINATAVGGDRQMGRYETCDDGNTGAGDGCSASCLIEGVCGNRRLEAPEECDDGNSTSGDGCNNCIYEPWSELEPNDTYQTANPLSNPDRLISGTVETSSSYDFFTFTLARRSDLAIDTFEDAVDSCPNGDTRIALLSSNGTTVVASDDDDGVGYCSSLDPTADTGMKSLLPGVYYVRVGGYDAAQAYKLRIRTLASCGNGARESSELCDDGNSNDADGCTMMCSPPAVLESEPNEDGSPSTGGSTIVGNDFSAAMADGPYTADTLIAAALTPAGDEDVFALRNPTAAPVKVTVQTYGPMAGSCGGLDTGITIRNMTGTSLISDDESGDGSCSLVSYTIPAMTTVYAHVVDYGDTSAIPSYHLWVDFP